MLDTRPVDLHLHALTMTIWADQGHVTAHVLGVPARIHVRVLQARLVELQEVSMHRYVGWHVAFLISLVCNLWFYFSSSIYSDPVDTMVDRSVVRSGKNSRRTVYMCTYANNSERTESTTFVYVTFLYARRRYTGSIKLATLLLAVNCPRELSPPLFIQGVRFAEAYACALLHAQVLSADMTSRTDSYWGTSYYNSNSSTDIVTEIIGFQE